MRNDLVTVSTSVLLLISNTFASLAARHRLEEIADMSIYFQRLVPLEDYEPMHGSALGQDLLWKAGLTKWRRIERLEEVVLRSKALKGVVKELPWAKEMMVCVLRGSIDMNRVVRTKLDCVSDKEAAQIGRNLIPALMTEQLAESGIDLWKIQNRAVKELMEKYAWFEPMAVVIGKGIVKTAAWGLIWRVTVGAMLSMSDLGTDIVILKQFWEGGKALKTFRDLSLGSLVMSIGLQITIVIPAQYRKMGWRRMLKEMAIVLSGLKPAWDAYKVANGAEQEKGSKFDALMEMTVGKCLEIFAESIPSMLIQLSAIFRTLETDGAVVSRTMVVSLLVSALTTGFVSATLTYDLDTNPKSRAQKPGFYGCIPDSSVTRLSIFIAMTCISTVQVLLKSIFFVVLENISRSYVTIYFGMDVGFYLLLVTMRRDLSLWVNYDYFTKETEEFMKNATIILGSSLFSSSLYSCC